MLCSEVDGRSDRHCAFRPFRPSHRSRQRRRLAVVLPFVLSLLLAACGGGESGDPPAAPTEPSAGEQRVKAALAAPPFPNLPIPADAQTAAACGRRSTRGR
jgi:hypothetical protein